MPRKSKGIISAEGQELLEDKDIWGNETALQGAIHESRKRERSHEDGLFMPPADWFLREGQGRELLGEWMKLTSVRSPDQRRMKEETLTHSQRTIGSTRSRREKNQTDATYVGPSG